MSDARFDLVVIGGGSGGLAGAFRAASHGARVALLEPGALGGTCVNVGCVPKKAMWLAAELAQRMELARRLGFDLPEQPPSLDWRAFVADRQRYIENIHASYRRRLDESGIALLPQRGRLVAADTVELVDGVRLRAGQILLATGGHPVRPDIPGAQHGIDSDGFFALCEAPERVAIVGAGYIAVELAGVLQALGSRVDLLVRGQRLLESFDGDLAAQLAEDYRQHGVHAHFGHSLRAVEQDRHGRVRLRNSADVLSDPYDTLIFATGRRPNTTGLGLEAAGVACDARGFVVVDAQQRTSVPTVHAVGDITPQPALTPVAIAAARRLMDRLFGAQPNAAVDLADVATVVFSHPPIGRVGLDEAQARARFGDADVHVYRTRFRPMLHALADSPQHSLFKLVCVGDERRVVGLHLLGEGADEMLQGFAVALRRGITLQDLHDTIAIHPTSAEEIVLLR